jgi:hypothetical protein
LEAGVGDLFLVSVSSGQSTAFSLSDIVCSGLSGNSDLITVSSVIVEIEGWTPDFSDSTQISLDGPGSRLTRFVGVDGFRADADGAQGSKASVALGAGLGTGILILILAVCGVLFWFFTRRRDETDITQESEFSNDSTDLPDSWGEHANLTLGGAGLDSECLTVEIPFLESGTVEEGSWAGAVVR